MYCQSIKWKRCNVSRTRIFQAIPLEIGITIRLDSNANHHVARVLRAKINDPLVLFNGNGYDYAAIIVGIDKKGVDVDIQHCLAGNVESSIELILAQGMARGDKMDFIVQKAVELGVSKIFPLITERCNVRLEGKREERRLEHWQSVIISACEQSGRNRIPEIFAPQTLVTWLTKSQAHLSFVLSPHVQNKLPPEKKLSNSSIAVLIGPEGGLSDKEVALATNAHFLPLNLGPRVLRTETATIAALTALQLRYGDLG
jgi:16S rRNA (uracil1498-N3)-methyltransferase